MDIKAIVLLAAISMLLIVLAFLPTAPKRLPSSTGAYIEIVSSQEGSYSLEYIVTDKGLIFRKEGAYPDVPKIALSKASPEKATALFSRWDGSLVPQDSINCNNCAIYHLFYHDGQETIRYNIEKGSGSTFMENLLAEAEAAYSSGEMQTPFFIQLVYSKAGLARDYHFFEDGTVIREDFGPAEGELIDAAVFSIDGRAIDLVTDAPFSSPQPDSSCTKYDYGYMEIRKGEKYVFSFTCGEGTSAADLLYSKLLMLVEK
ncbi:MAG: hypothetical protein ABIG96_03770 [Candidatus Micrarchaeota archaeon]